MEKYTIYCNEEQVKKALKLRAPISEAMSRYNSLLVYERIEQGKETKEYYNNQGIAICGKRTYKSPTAEQMIGWLDEQGISIEIYFSRQYALFDWSLFTRRKIIKNNKPEAQYYYTRKEATLAAVDAAFDYLEKAKEEQQ